MHTGLAASRRCRGLHLPHAQECPDGLGKDGGLPSAQLSALAQRLRQAVQAAPWGSAGAPLAPRCDCQDPLACLLLVLLHIECVILCSCWHATRALVM